MLTTPVVARYVRVVVEAPAGQAVLRRARLTAWKHEPVAGAPARLRAPTVDGEFKEEAWAGMRPQVEGFVSAERGGLADPPTTVYLCRTEEALFVAAYMREDRPDTMVAAKTRRDAALWEEESFEVRLKPGSGEPLRFIVNPRGARYEALGQDAGWNGAWTAATRRYPGGWSAELRLPYETLGVRGVPGASWQADFIRRRKNVREETSSWAYRGQRRWRGEAWGRLLLE
jgi:hypothetical protein